MSRKILLTGILVCAITGLGWAQPSAGDGEFTLAGTGSSTNDFDNNNLGVDVSLGFYLSDHILLDVRQAVSWIDPNVGDSQWFGATRGAIDLQLLNNLQPFVGVNVGAIYGDVDDTFFWSPEAGVKWWVQETTFIFGRAEYQIPFDSDKDESFVYTFGVGFNW